MVFGLPSIDAIFRPVGNIFEDVGNGVSDVFRGITSTTGDMAKGVSDIFKDPIGTVHDIGGFTKAVAGELGGTISSLIGHDGIGQGVKEIVDASVGEVGRSVVDTATGLGENPLVAGSILAGSGGFLALGVGAAAIALMVALR